MKTGSNTARHLRLLRLVLIAVPITYVASYGVSLRYILWQRVPDATTYRVLRFYQPLCRVMPKSLMVDYTQACGLTDIEAFFFVQVMASDLPVGPSNGNVSFQQEFTQQELAARNNR